jgi:phenylacetate-CoA ligase
VRLVEIARAVVPPRLRTPIKRWLYPLISLDKRVGKEGYWRLKAFLQKAQWWNRECIEAWQLRRLREMVEYAYQHVPGYHFLYCDAGVKPEDIVSLADVPLLPFTTKELLRDNLQDFTAKGIPSWRLRYVTTGGSTGIPFGFYYTEVNSWMESAFMHSGWERAGWQLGDMSAVLRGTFVGSEERFWDYDPVNRELLLSSYYLTEQTYPKYIEKIEEFSPKHLQAYPSAVTILADLLLEHSDVGRIDFQVILLGSENIHEWQKEKLRRTFPCARLFGWYGHAEQVILAPWCEDGEYYHVWPFYGLVEILDEENREVNEGKVGEIVGTSFWNYATPFIRYRTMDRAQKGAWGCEKCGRQFPILESIEGRLQEIIVTRTGRYISMTAINMHSDVFDSVRQFQFYQDTPGKVTFRVVRKGSYTDQDTAGIYWELKKKLGDDMELEIVFVDKIPRTQRGKHRFLEQKLDVWYGE